MMASMSRTIIRAMQRDPDSWRDCKFKDGENRVERRRRSKKTREDQKKQSK
jgi:hypothetical protein